MADSSDLAIQVSRISRHINSFIANVANEPSLGMYRINEHVHNTVPKIRETTKKLNNSNKLMNGVTFDAEYDCDALKNMSKIKQFGSVLSSLEEAIILEKKLRERELVAKAELQRSKVPQIRNYGSINK